MINDQETNRTVTQSSELIDCITKDWLENTLYFMFGLEGNMVTFSYDKFDVQTKLDIDNIRRRIIEEVIKPLEYYWDKLEGIDLDGFFYSQLSINFSKFVKKCQDEDIVNPIVHVLFGGLRHSLCDRFKQIGHSYEFKFLPNECANVPEFKEFVEYACNMSKNVKFGQLNTVTIEDDYHSMKYNCLTKDMTIIFNLKCPIYEILPLFDFMDKDKNMSDYQMVDKYRYCDGRNDGSKILTGTVPELIRNLISSVSIEDYGKLVTDILATGRWCHKTGAHFIIATIKGPLEI